MNSKQFHQFSRGSRSRFRHFDIVEEEEESEKPIASFNVQGTIPTKESAPTDIRGNPNIRCSWCGEKGCVGTCTLPIEAFG